MDEPRRGVRSAIPTSHGRPWTSARSARWICARGRVPDLAGRDAIMPPEGSIEIRKVAETHVERDRGDVLIGTLGIAQHPVCASEALAEHERREREAFVLEQLV